jgi:uncharacterized protein (TIGR03084 family)
MAVDLALLAADLHAETVELERLLAPLDAAGWALPTPAPGWRVHDQVSHLAYFDEAAMIAALDPEAFRAELEDARTDPDGITGRITRQYRDLAPDVLLRWFRETRLALLHTLPGLEASRRVPWYGPDMSVASSLTARIMETWAHGQDIAEAVGKERALTPALRQVAHIGVRTFANSFTTRGLAVPDVEVFVALTAADGATWTWGDPGAPERVEGDAFEFCLVVTQRRNVVDTALRAVGSSATRWLEIAQAFAGPPGAGRPPRTGER